MSSISPTCSFSLHFELCLSQPHELDSNLSHLCPFVLPQLIFSQIISPAPCWWAFHSLLNVHPFLPSFLKRRQPLLPRVIRLLNCTVTSLGSLVFLASSFSFIPAGSLKFQHTLMLLPVQPFLSFFFFYVTPSSLSLPLCSFILCCLLHTVRDR